MDTFEDSVDVDLGLGGDPLDDALEDLENDCSFVGYLGEDDGHR